MSRLTVVFHVSVYALAAMSSLMLALAEGTPFPVGVGVPLAILALLLNARWQLVRLGTAWSNALGVGALLLAGVEFFGEREDSRLLAGAHLLSYLLWIVLFLPKGNRQYWWVLALGVLHVAVGSVLTSDATYGALLVCYFFCAIWTLSVFSLYHAERRVEGEPAGEAAPESRGSSGPPAETGGARRRSRAVGAIQQDPREHWLSFRFLLGTVGTAAASMLLAAVLFLLIPRNIWAAQFGMPSEAQRGRLGAITGFSEEVRLGGMGEILESTEPVMEVQAFRGRNSAVAVPDLALSLGQEEPLFRGAVLTTYEDRQWRSSRLAPPLQQLPQYDRRGQVRQIVRLQPIGTRILLGMQPAVGGFVHGMTENRNSRQVSIDPASHVLSHRSEGRRRDIITYTLYTPESVPHGGSSLDPWKLALGSPGPTAETSPESYLREALALPSRLERLTELARQVSGADEGVPPRERARRLEAYLRDSGRFIYTLRSAVQDASIDPVEDFVFNRREGHCEYYASALTLMLRGADIPARLVTGFKGGEADPSSGVFVVQQRHAHAWTEAWIEEAGNWVTLDGTPPGGRSEAVQSVMENLGALTRVRMFLSDSWSNYVVNMNFNRQQQSIYTPMREWLDEWRQVAEARGGRAAAVLSVLKEFVTSPSRWFSWQGGVLSFTLLLISAGGWWSARRLWRLVGRLRARYGAQQRRQRTQVAFYERFQRICAALGLSRETSQTPREFAAAVRRRWRSPLSPAGLTEFPERLAEFFYRVRFGHEELDPRTVSELDHELERFEQALTTPSVTAEG